MLEGEHLLEPEEGEVVVNAEGTTDGRGFLRDMSGFGGTGGRTALLLGFGGSVGAAAVAEVEAGAAAGVTDKLPRAELPPRAPASASGGLAGADEGAVCADARRLAGLFAGGVHVPSVLQSSTADQRFACEQRFGCGGTGGGIDGLFVGVVVVVSSEAPALASIALLPLKWTPAGVEVVEAEADAEAVAVALVANALRLEHEFECGVGQPESESPAVAVAEAAEDEDDFMGEAGASVQSPVLALPAPDAGLAEAAGAAGSIAESYEWRQAT